MSLFPSRLLPGGTITFHLRVMVSRPSWIQLRGAVISPHGQRTHCFERLDFLLPAPVPCAEEEELLERSGGFFEGTPLLLAAHHLADEAKCWRFFFENLKGIRDASHFYATYGLAQDAPLGRYRLEIETHTEGRRQHSPSVESDHFFVERLELKDVRVNGNKRTAWLGNPSPEPVPAKLCQSLDERHLDFQSRLTVLPANSVTPVSFECDAAYLLYAGGTERILLAPFSGPRVLRNPCLTWLPKRGGTTTVFLDDTKGVQLEAEARKLWYLADGFRTREVLRSEKNSATYDLMVEHGLILELSEQTVSETLRTRA